MKKIIYIVSLAILSIACESRTYEEISDKTPIAELVTYNKDVKPIIDANCISCHSPGGSASFQALTGYNQVKNNIDKIIDRINRPTGDPQKMPQGGSLSSSQTMIITKWKTDGLTEN